MPTSEMRPLSGFQHFQLVVLARMILAGAQLDESVTAAEYNNGYLLLDYVNREPMVASLRFSQAGVYDFPIEPRSGTDKLRQSIRAKIKFAELSDGSASAYYLSAEDIPLVLAPEDLPIYSGQAMIWQEAEQFVVEGSGMQAESFNSVGAAVKHFQRIWERINDQTSIANKFFMKVDESTELSAHTLKPRP